MLDFRKIKPATEPLWLIRSRIAFAKSRKRKQKEEDQKEKRKIKYKIKEFLRKLQHKSSNIKDINTN